MLVPLELPPTVHWANADDAPNVPAKTSKPNSKDLIVFMNFSVIK